MVGTVIASLSSAMWNDMCAKAFYDFLCSEFIFLLIEITIIENFMKTIKIFVTFISN